MPARVFTFTLAMAAAACTCSAHAASPSVGINAGLSVTSAHRWTHTASIDVIGRTRNVHGVHWQPNFALIWVRGRATRVEDLDNTVYVGAGGVRLVDWWSHAFFGFQLAATSRRTGALSSTPQFVSSLGWQDRHWQIMVRHISNGKLFGGKNLGETMFVVGIQL